MAWVGLGLPAQPDGYIAEIARVNPATVRIYDPVDFHDPDWSVWYVEEVMGDRTRRRLRSVQFKVLRWVTWAYPKKPKGWCAALADVHILSALYNPRSPFGLFYRPSGSGAVIGEFGIYHEEWYRRERGGVLVPMGERDQTLAILGAEARKQGWTP